MSKSKQILNLLREKVSKKETSKGLEIETDLDLSKDFDKIMELIKNNIDELMYITFKSVDDNGDSLTHKMNVPIEKLKLKKIKSSDDFIKSINTTITWD